MSTAQSSNMTAFNVNDDAGKDDFESYMMFRISK